MRPFRLVSKDINIMIVANTRKEAFAKFFKKLKAKEIGIEEIGNLVMLHDKDEEYPFRTVPSLFLLGLMDEETAIANIAEVVGSNPTQAGKMLYNAAEKDKWIVKAVTGKPLKHFPPLHEET